MIDKLKFIGCVVGQLLPVRFDLGAELIVPDKQTPFLRFRVDGEEGFGGFAQPCFVQIIFCVRSLVSLAEGRLRDAQQAQRVITILGV
jgi:hypothetical protein